MTAYVYSSSGESEKSQSNNRTNHMTYILCEVSALFFIRIRMIKKSCDIVHRSMRRITMDLHINLCRNSCQLVEFSIYLTILLARSLFFPILISLSHWFVMRTRVCVCVCSWTDDRIYTFLYTHSIYSITLLLCGCNRL